MTGSPADEPDDSASIPTATGPVAGNRAARRAIAAPDRRDRSQRGVEPVPPVAGAPVRSGPAAARDREVATIASDQILKGSDAINIEHNGRIYQLRRTRQGKLILTK